MGRHSSWKLHPSSIGLPVLVLAGALLHLQLLPVDTAGLLHDLRNEGPNRVDRGRMVRGYYQNLVENVDERRGGLPQRIANWIIDGEGSPRWETRLANTEALRDTTEGYLLTELVPGITIDHLGVPLSINRWGQRDRDCEWEKPPQTLRIAFVGASNSMGWGVRVEEGYVELLEAKLNHLLVARSAYNQFEAINFSSPGYSAPEFLYVIEQLTANFDPDLIIVENCAAEIRFNISERIASRFLKNRELRYSYIRELVDKAGISKNDALFRVKRRLMPLREALLAASYHHMAEWSAESGIPVAIAVLRLEVAPRVDPLLEWSAQEAERLGLIALRVFNAYQGQDHESMYISNAKDHHPSAKAHARLAEDLYDQLMNDPRTRNLLLGTADQELE